MIAVISDTHEQESLMKKAAALIKERNPKFVVHCGDIVSPPVLENFKGLRMKIVFGNNDGEKKGLVAMSSSLGFEEPQEELEFELEGKKFYVYHGHDKAKLDEHVNSGQYDYVLTGHTHKKRDETVGKTRVINPGALFRCNPYTFAFLDAVQNELEYVEVEK